MLLQFSNITVCGFVDGWYKKAEQEREEKEALGGFENTR
jgi:hypothetical protein